MHVTASANHAPALLILVAMAAACDSTTAPDPARPDLVLNTVAITVSGGAMVLDEVVEALGGFQHVTTGQGTGIRIGAVPSAAALSIHLPGTPHAGQFSLGRWDPGADFARHDTIPIFHGHSPRVSFGGDRALALGIYSSFDGVVLIDSVTLPEYGNGNSVGQVRGRIEARGAVDPAYLGPGVPLDPDTVDITVEFRVSLEGWHDGRADAAFGGGALAGMSAPDMYGSGNKWYIGGFPHADPRLVALLQGRIAGTGERLAVWFGTKLPGPGSADISPLDPEDVQWPGRWPDHFVAAMIGGIHGRFAGAISGRIELDAHEPYTHPRWGETRGRLVVELELGAPDGAGEREWTTIEVDFHIPSFWVVSYQTGAVPSLISAATPLSPSSLS
jgi:hypothetical protein